MKPIDLNGEMCYSTVKTTVHEHGSLYGVLCKTVKKDGKRVSEDSKL